jgi:hypothetical protein
MPMSPSSSDTTDAASMPGPMFVALSQAQLARVTGRSRDIHSQTLHVFLGNRPRGCDRPDAIGEPLCRQWMVSFALSPERQRAGSFDFEDRELEGYIVSTGQGGPTGAGGCGSSAGSLIRGMVSILEITERSLVVRLDGVTTIDGDFSGTYRVDRCPDVPAPDGGVAFDAYR